MASLQTFLQSFFFGVALNVFITNAALPGMLFPKDSERREVKDLSGIWDFRADMSDNRNGGFENMWFAKPLWQVKYYDNENLFASRQLQNVKINLWLLW